MKKLTWFTLLLVLVATTAFAQPTPKDPQLERFIQKARPNFGGVWKPAPQAKRAVSSNTNTPPYPVPLPPPVGLGPSVWSNGETYLVPVDRPADMSVEIYLDGVLIGKQSGAVTTGQYNGEEKVLKGTFPITGAGLDHSVLLRATTPDGEVFEFPGTYSLPLHPIPQVIPVTMEGQNYRDITPHATFIGGNAEDIDIKGSFVVMGEYSNAVNEWDPLNPDYKAPRGWNNRPMAERESVYLRKGELVASHRYGLNYFNGIVAYKFFLKNWNGTFTTHEVVKAPMQPYQAPEKTGPSPIEFHVRSDWHTVITERIVTKKALGGYFFINVYGTRTGESCPDYYQNFWQTYDWGVIPPDMEDYTIALSTYLPRGFDFQVVITVNLEVAPNQWENFYFHGDFKGMNNPWECYPVYPVEPGGKG